MQQGGCLCGAVRFELTGAAVRSGICHCRTCRKVASAPAMAFAIFPVEALNVLRGELKVFQSSPGVLRSFCGKCGSPLIYRSDEQPGQISVMTGSLDQPQSIVPTYHLWTSQKIDWFDIADGRDVYETTRSAANIEATLPGSKK
jgi:hypothetical protein